MKPSCFYLLSAARITGMVVRLFVPLEAAPPTRINGRASSVTVATVHSASLARNDYANAWPLAASTPACLPFHRKRASSSTACSRLAIMDAAPMCVESNLPNFGNARIMLGPSQGYTGAVRLHFFNSRSMSSMSDIVRNRPILARKPPNNASANLSRIQIHRRHRRRGRLRQTTSPQPP